MLNLDIELLNLDIELLNLDIELLNLDIELLNLDIELLNFCIPLFLSVSPVSWIYLYTWQGENLRAEKSYQKEGLHHTPNIAEHKNILTNNVTETKYVNIQNKTNNSLTK